METKGHRVESKKSRKPRKPTKPTKPTSARRSPSSTLSRPIQAVPQRDDALFIVGLGASAGGLEAFGKFFKSLPEKTGMAFALVTHLGPQHPSLMPELIQRCTRVPVKLVTDGMPADPNHIYVIPPDRTMGIMHGAFQLMARTERDFHTPINYFFRALAQDVRERAVGVVLSGTGSDGALGLKAIKEQLGLVIAQDPETAKFPGMPESAIATGLTDYVLPPEEMPARLLRYAEVLRRGPVSATLEAESAGPLGKILFLLRSHTSHDFSGYKRNTVLRRVRRRMGLHHLEHLVDYVRYLQERPHEIEALFKDLLIGVTSFFRDPETFEILKKRVLPQLLDDRPDNTPVRVWIPGVASGEEAYSVGILLQEYMESFQRSLTVQIFASDIDEDAIQTARTGRYPESIVDDVEAHRLKRFFNKEGSHYRIRRDIREMLVFAVQNTIKDPPFTHVDMICCRNLLIYLDVEMQKKLLPLFHFALKPGGILFLGTSENIGDFVDLFSVIDSKWKIYQRRDSNASTRAAFDIPLALPAPKEARRRVGNTPRVAELTERALLQNHTPACVIATKKGDIVYVHGRTGRFLEPAPGSSGWNVLEMARGGLKIPLAAAFHTATQSREPVRRDGLRLKDEETQRVVNIVIHRMPLTEEDEDLVMVLFEEVHAPQPRAPEPPRKRNKKPIQAYQQLEADLHDTRENLQTTIEELETSNEELKSMNEEYQSTNQELKSANEELETSREELQSLNEELATLNAELEEKIERLSSTHEEMQSFLNSMEIPTVFLDDNLCVKRFTTQIEQLINLIPTDVGRPISHIVSKVEDDSLVEDSRRVRESMRYSETKVRSKEGHWYLRRIIPYRTADNRIDGVVVNFVDIHELQAAAQELKTSETARHYAEAAVETLRQLLLVLDQELNVAWVNGLFYQRFHTSPGEVIGRPFVEIGNGMWDLPDLRQRLGRLLRRGEPLENVAVEREIPEQGQRRYLLNAHRIVGNSKLKEILVSIQEVTECRT